MPRPTFPINIRRATQRLPSTNRDQGDVMHFQIRGFRVMTLVPPKGRPNAVLVRSLHRLQRLVLSNIHASASPLHRFLQDRHLFKNVTRLNRSLRNSTKRGATPFPGRSYLCYDGALPRVRTKGRGYHSRLFDPRQRFQF